MAGRPPITAGQPYDLFFEPRAEREYARLHEPMLDRVNRAIDALAVEPRPVDATKLAGRDDYRIRVGDWRVVYEIDDARRRILLVRIAHRRDVYRR